MAQDRGYAWVIPFACCFINAALFGSYRSYGLFYSVMLDTFNVGRSDASWPFSLCMTVIHLAGPISGGLKSHFTTRTVMLVGCFLAALGAGLCYTARSVAEITAYIGIIQGFGIGLTYVQNNEIINAYFVKFRATANGISLAGGTIGAFALSYLMEWSLAKFNLNQCFLMISMVIMVTLPVCLLLRPYRDHATPYTERRSSIEKVINIATLYLKSYDLGPADVKVKDENVKPLSFGRRESFVIKPVKTMGKVLQNSLLNMERKVSKAIDGEEAIKIRDRFKKDPTQLSLMGNICTILTHPLWILTALTHMAYFWAAITYMMVIVDYANDKGLPMTDSVQLISAFSGGDLIGRLGSGWLMDNKLIPLKYLAMTSMLGTGLLMQATTVTSDFLIFFTISALLGLLSGLINILLNILFCKYLGTDRASLSFGLSAFFCGLVTLARPAVVGMYRDSKDGSYDGLLTMLGLVSVMAGALWLFEPMLKRAMAEKDHGSKSEPELPPKVQPIVMITTVPTKH